MDLVTRRLRTATALAGPLLFVDRPRGARLGELVRLRMEGAPERRGQVIDLSEERAVVQVLEETRGLAPRRTEVVLSGEVASFGVARAMLGRAFDGLGRPADGLPAPIPEARLPVSGAPLNAVRRERPSQPIETGISAIDGLNTLVRGQKLPIFSCAGLPAARLAAQIVAQARVRAPQGGAARGAAELPEAEPPSARPERSGAESKGGSFCVVFAALGASWREREAFLESFEATGARARTVAFLNGADAPPIERLMTPRYALTAAEHLAFAHGLHVLVVMTDMSAYCDALREVALAREELPGRRGYPGYMYTDLASLYERAGRIAGRPGSVTQLPVLTMPDDDLTHPIPDLTGYITEGQIVLSRDLDRKGVYPPIDVLPSLARLMNQGIGAGRTRQDHRGLADQLYALHARGCDVRRMAAIVGASNLSDEERRLLAFSDRFEGELVGQGAVSRTFEETLDLGWRLLAPFPAEALARVRREDLALRHHPEADHGEPAHHADGAPGGAGAARDGAGGGAAPPRQA